MSTTFDVYPCEPYLPTFKEILNFSNQLLNDRLLSLGISVRICLKLSIKDMKTHKDINFDLNDKFLWDNSRYVWFYINEISGGTDVYYNQINELVNQIWQDEIKSNINAKRLKDKVNSSLNLGYYWSFRRGVGQPGIINLSYGLIAASLAKITNGFIYSDDGAWDYDCFPDLADNFIKYYFIPKLSTKIDYKEWSEECIKSIRVELMNDYKSP